MIFRTKSRGERLALAQRQDLWKPSLEASWTGGGGAGRKKKPRGGRIYPTALSGWFLYRQDVSLLTTQDPNKWEALWVIICSSRF